jgi:hypothetical protein
MVYINRLQVPSLIYSHSLWTHHYSQVHGHDVQESCKNEIDTLDDNVADYYTVYKQGPSSIPQHLRYMFDHPLESLIRCSVDTIRCIQEATAQNTKLSAQCLAKLHSFFGSCQSKSHSTDNQEYISILPITCPPLLIASRSKQNFANNPHFHRGEINDVSAVPQCAHLPKSASIKRHYIAFIFNLYQDQYLLYLSLPSIPTP